MRELDPQEFALAEEVWYHYRQQKTDQINDRIFGAFIDGKLVGVARCKKHADGLEVDGVFVIEEFRGQGLARKLMNMLIGSCGNDILYLHSTLELVDFYASFNFKPIPEGELPPTIKERLIFCLGEMKGCGVCPMRRAANNKQ